MSTHGLPANVLYALARVLVELPYDWIFHTGSRRPGLREIRYGRSRYDGPHEC